MARVVVAGAGAIGASIAYHSLCGRGRRRARRPRRDRGRATGKAMGGVRQQFTTGAEVRLARASVRLFRRARRAALRAGRLPLPRHDRAGLPSSRSGASVQAVSAFPSSVSTRRSSGAARRRRARGVDLPRGRDRRPGRVTRELVRRAAALGVDVREHTDALALEADDARGRVRRLVAGGGRGAGVELPSDRSSASSPTSVRSAGCRPSADDDRGERLPLPPVGADGLRLAMPEPRRAGTGRQRSARRSSRTGARGSATAIRARRGRRSSAPGPASTT